MHDSISDMLTRIRNAQMVNKKTVVLPYSKIKMAISEILIKEGFIEGLNKVGRKTNKFMELELKYDSDKRPRISEITRISKSSQRVYVRAKDVRPYQKGLGIYIISTPKGLMTDRMAKKSGLGGEVILRVW